MASFPPQLENETDGAYRAFTLFCQQGDRRSSTRVATEMSRARSLISRWSAKYSWIERARDYDLSVHAGKNPEYEGRNYADEVRRHQEESLRISKNLRYLGLKMIRRFNEVVDRMKMEPKDLGTIAKIFTVAMDLEAHALQLDKLIPALEASIKVTEEDDDNE